MPRKNHSESRKLFVNEAKKLSQKEFLKWFSLSSSFPNLLKEIHKHNINIPTLFIQGEQDHMFIKDVKAYIKKKKVYLIQVIEGCGHVVNIESSKIFNNQGINFIIRQSKTGK